MTREIISVLDSELDSDFSLPLYDTMLFQRGAIYCFSPAATHGQSGRLAGISRIAVSAVGIPSETMPTKDARAPRTRRLLTGAIVASGRRKMGRVVIKA